MKLSVNFLERIFVILEKSNKFSVNKSVLQTEKPRLSLPFGTFRLNTTPSKGEDSIAVMLSATKVYSGISQPNSMSFFCPAL